MIAAKTPPRGWGRKLAPYGYLSPALISILALSILPLLYTFYLAFTNATAYNMRTGLKFIGMANFVEMVTGGFARVFFPVLGWTLLYALLACLSQYAVGMLAAVLLNNPHLRETRLLRALLIIPWAIPAAIAILAWQGQFHTSAGMINYFLTSTFGIDPIPWLQSPNLAKVAVLIVSLWLGFPFFMTMCLGTLQSLPTEFYEAAEIDGATNWQKFWKVTFPLMARFTGPLLVGSFALNFNNFGTAFLLTGGGPARVGPFMAGYTDILVSVGYKLSVQLNRYALSAALSVILFLLVAGLSLINMRATGAFGEEE